MDGPFSVLTLPEAISDFGYAEAPGGGVYIEDRELVRECLFKWGILSRRAVRGRLGRADRRGREGLRVTHDEGGRGMIDQDTLARAEWRKSSFSGSGGTGGGNCVEVGPLADGRIAVRNSHDPDVGAVLFTCTELVAWIKGCQAGEFDDLTHP